MVVDKQGRAYIGNFGFDLAAQAPLKPAEIVLVTATGDMRVVAQDLLFPNGTVISARRSDVDCGRNLGQSPDRIRYQPRRQS